MASVMVGTPSAVHGKLHKRHPVDPPNVSRRTTPTIQNPAVKRLSLEHGRSKTPREELWEVDGISQQPPSPSSLRLKTHMRKSPGKDSGTVDLSRSITENESLTGLGLGIDDYGHGSAHGNGPRSVNDVPFASVRNTRHMRSTSGTSQYSNRTSGSFQRPNATYVHPMRQTPRPYTPPISRSMTMSTGMSTGGASSDEDQVSKDTFPYEHESLHSRGLLTSVSNDVSDKPADSTTSFPTIAATRFSTTSQTSLPAGRRSRGATLQSIETTSGASSRPSMDKAMHFLRGQRSNSTSGDIEFIDPAESRAASIRAARKAYQEREDAKDRKAEKAGQKQAERQQRKQHRKDEKKQQHQRRKSEQSERGSGGGGRASRPATATMVSEKAGGDIGAGDYATLSAPPSQQTGRDQQPTARGSVEKKSTLAGATTAAARDGQRKRKRGAKSRWAIFIAWFRTRLLRLGTKSNGSKS